MTVIDICDDEQLWINKAREIISAYFKDTQEVWINSFDDPGSLIDSLIKKKEQADIIILDIDMPGMNGFDTARMLKEAYPDMLLLFYTVHEQYVFDAFQFQPFRYIRKAHAEQEMKLALTAAVQVLSKRNDRSVVLKTNDESCKVEVRNIVWFEVEKRRCNVHLNDGRVLSVRKTIKELFTEINSPDIIMLHSGAAVNVKYIKNYSSFDVTLEDGTKLIVSRSRMKDIRNSVLEYWGDRM